MYLPGKTTHGHYQIELACETCHTPLDGVRSESCLTCHGEDLAQADDSHPPSKFLDPRNAELTTKLDARECITCHAEHRPELTLSMGVTLPNDYCAHCHAEIGEERPTHAGLDHQSCQAAGCHNFHDNRGLHEDYLEQHLDEPAHLARRLRPLPAPDNSSDKQLTAAHADGPAALRNPQAVAEWAASAHARSGVNCSTCHVVAGVDVARPDQQVCAECHRPQVDTLQQGRHAMRLAVGLGPMQPELARLPMHKDAFGRELGCQSCHGAHAYDKQHAAVDACLGCHADDHSSAFEASPHAALLRAELDGTGEAGTGVSCATCHMPNLPVAPGSSDLWVQHNQNDNLRPNDKMLRSVCAHCHGAGFALDALADSALVRANFRGGPRVHVNSLDWIKQRRAARSAGTVLTP